MPSKIKTPRTMSTDEFLTVLEEQLAELNRDMAEVADRLEAVLGPAPRPELTLIPGDRERRDDA
jgi:hypothetical protein